MQSIMEYEEHEKRAWSVDFSRTEPTRLVSGSDDGKVGTKSFPLDKSMLPIVRKKYPVGQRLCRPLSNPGSWSCALVLPFRLRSGVRGKKQVF